MLKFIKFIKNHKIFTNRLSNYSNQYLTLQPKVNYIPKAHQFLITRCKKNQKVDFIEMAIALVGYILH